ncbi:hypothetical protein BKG76_00190 [Mycobacteroides franklinii]|uniref:Uncharacterized protein n=1 Tax=Mycobacteroides franklinii TaxID=948102 RepID=A0A1S1LHL0_9MYCO|nr:hypothetical protein [Mycobacteroides franklinii]OHU31674.1 hypothetical protein BKG76_00190 [Mycobacteroides franklinii]
MSDVDEAKTDQTTEAESEPAGSRWKSRRFRVVGSLVLAVLLAAGAGGYVWVRHARSELLQYARDNWSSINDDRSANAVAHDMVRYASHLKQLPGFGTFGTAEPELLRSIARGLAPHLAQLAGADGPGFATADLWPFRDADSMRDLLSILDQDHESAIITNASVVAQCVTLTENAGQHGVYGDWPSSLEVTGRLGQVMAEAAEDSNLFGRESARWRNAHDPNATETLAKNAQAILDQVPAFTDTIDAHAINSDLNKAVEKQKGNPSSDLGDEGAKYMRNLVSPLILNNTVTEEVAILQGLINAHPEVAADPDLADYITDGRLDTNKLLADEKAVDTKLANAAYRNYKKYGLDLRTILDQERLGKLRDWSR